MRPQQFVTDAGKGKLGPAYFLRGPDRFLQEECRTAVAASLEPSVRSWCLAEIEFVPGRLGRDLEGARQMPMLGGRSFLLFADPEDFRHAHDQDYEALENYLERPSPFATVVFIAAEPDHRRRFIQMLEKKAEVVELSPLSRKQAAHWLEEYLNRGGVEIDGKLAETIVARFEQSRDARREAGASGVNLLWVRTEIEKLLTARPTSRRVEPQDLEIIVGFREEHVIGKLLAAIAERQWPQALAHLRALLESKESEMLLLWSMADLFRKALEAPGGNTAGPGGRRGAWARWANPFAPLEIAPRVNHNYSRAEILQCLRLLRQTDLGIKSSWKDSRILLEFLVWRIVVGRGSKSFPGLELPAPPPEA